MTWVLKVLGGQFGGWILGGICGVVLAVVGGLWLANVGLRSELKAANDKLATAKADLKQCRLNNRVMDDAIKLQNLAVEGMREAAEARRKAGEGAVREAREATVRADRRVAEILRARPGQDRCASADRLILESLP